MPANTSSAVMQQRREAPDALDDFPTPPWATRALLERLSEVHGYGASCWEPACNRGHMVGPLHEAFGRVDASDVHDYGWAGQQRVTDFLLEWDRPPHILAEGVDWIVTNPPFRLGAEFALQALREIRVGVALLVRNAFLEGGGRYETLYRRHPPTEIWQFCERVIMHKGVLRDPDRPYRDPASGKMKKPSTATAYLWLVWYGDGRPRRPLDWIPPCRKRLERPGDYPEAP